MKKTKTKAFVLPDFKHGNLNVSATLAEFLGAENGNATLPALKAELSKGYKNVVFICFDGMGTYPMECCLDENDYLRRHTVDTLTSTFPSTTTNATTSLTTNKLPLEHGWFWWSVYFDKIKRNVNIFLDTDSWTNEKLDTSDCSPLRNYPYYFDQAGADCEYGINTVFPPFVKAAHPERNVQWNFETAKFFDHIKQICGRDGKQFVYAYNNEPDHSMHENGVNCAKTRELLQEISRRTEELAKQTPNTLFIITADHGMIDIEDYVYLYKDDKLYGMLETYPYLEPRALAFKVKPECKKEFENYFTQKYGEDFTLFTSAELLERGLFGDRGDRTALLGDYIAVGTYTHKQAVIAPDNMLFKGHHTSLTEEMLVPLILIKNK